MDVLDVNEPYPRVLRSRLDADLRLFPVVAVMGARQVGKSTLCRQVAQKLGMADCTLDDQSTLDFARADPEGLIRSLGEDGAFIDEAQRAPAILLAIKAAVDRRNRPGQYLVSGSNQPSMAGAVGDTLLGRAAYRTLRPLLLSELRFEEDHAGWSFLFGDDAGQVLKELSRRETRSGQLDWREVVTTGGFPRAVTAARSDRMRVLDEYARVFASRDIRHVIGIDSSDRFETFLRLVTTRVGQTLNYSGFATDVGVSVNTVRRWIDALQRSYLIDTIPAYSANAAQRTIKAPKLFAVDAAFALAAARERTPSGFHLENMVCSDLLAWRDFDVGRAVYHWRLPAGQEVDFVLEEDSKLLAVELKAASTSRSEDARHLRVFLDRYPATVRGLLLSADPEIRQVGPNLLAAPWWAVL